MMQFENATTAVEDVRGSAIEGENLNVPANLHSGFIGVNPAGKFDGVMSPAKISLKLDDTTASAGVSLYRAGPDTAYAFVRMETTIQDGRAVASTDQGGVFVAGSGVNLGLVVGLVVAGVVVLLIALMVAAVIVYFVAQPEKWKATKTSMKKSQMKLKRSFARQV